MKTSNTGSEKEPLLIWIYTQNPTLSLDATSWVEPTRELNKQGWQAILIAEGSTGWTNIRGLDVLLIERPQIYLFGQLIFHWRVIQFMFQQKQPVDVLLFHQMSALWLFPLRLIRPFLRRHRPRFIMDARTLHMTRADQQGLKDKLRRLFYATVNRTASLWVDGQLAITARLAEALHITPDKLWGVWSSGVSPEPFIEASKQRTFPAPAEPIRIIYVGSLNYERNLMPLAKAVVTAQAQNMLFELILIGSGTEQANLAAYAQDKAYIHVLPPVPHSEIPHHLSQAHIGVLPFPDELKFQVSSPIKLFEYMASGLAIMATRIACHTDVITDETCVFWIDGSTEQAMLESLMAIWQAQSQLATKSAAAMALSKNWTWYESARKLKTALEAGLSGQHATRFLAHPDTEMESS